MSSHDISSTSSPCASKINGQNDKRKQHLEELSSYIDNSLEPISNNSDGEEDIEEVKQRISLQHPVQVATNNDEEDLILEDEAILEEFDVPDDDITEAQTKFTAS